MEDYIGYLVCEECSGHYTLKEGEFPEDFVCCPCGGRLKYLDSLENPSGNPEAVNKSSFINKIFINIKSNINGALLSTYRLFNKSEGSSDGIRSKNDLFSVFCIMAIFLGIVGLMFTSTSTYLMSPASEVMVNASNEEFTYKTPLTKETEQSKYSPYNETRPINGTWGTIFEVSDYKYTPTNTLKPNIELEENKTIISSDELEKRTSENATIEQIGADEAKFPDRQGVCSDLDCFLTLGYGDCWADSYYLFDRCKSAGIKVRIVCCNNKLHRWVQIDRGA